MLHRLMDDGVMLMSQPAHAWVSGQMASAWGDGFDSRPEVLLAAEQHDIGWNEWELRPTFNAKTGLPHAFLELDTSSHLDIWSNVAARIESMSALAALLVSRHGTGLYERFHGSAEAPGMEPEVRAYLRQEKADQQRLLERLRAGQTADPRLEDAAIDRLSRLIAAWDWLSLIVCMNESDRGAVNSVPWEVGHIDLELSRLGPARWSVSPWPFRDSALELVAEGRLLPGPAPSELAMRSMLETAPLVRVLITLADASALE